MELQATPVAAAKSHSATPSTHRLVIRVEISSKAPPRVPVRRRISRGGLLLILGPVAVLLGWVAIIVFKTEPTSAPAATAWAPSFESQFPLPVPAPREPAQSVESAARKHPDAEPSTIHKVIPDVPRSARQTIRGTVRVSVRVMVDNKGTVLDANADEPGPSRYFERLSLQASKKWRFAPTQVERQRIVRVTFSFTRSGTSARAQSLR